jgi:EAL domain-containing protein (putative c-di-GMP-specific phosphodiesterase class I)
VLEALKASTPVAMDDFGTGYTSLAYLQRCRSTCSRSIAASSPDARRRDSTAIVRAILSLADALGMETTAEGIESRRAGRGARRARLHHGQGFHFFAPPAGARRGSLTGCSRNA